MAKAAPEQPPGLGIARIPGIPLVPGLSESGKKREGRKVTRPGFPFVLCKGNFFWKKQDH